jgi:hypothetical protein
MDAEADDRVRAGAVHPRDRTTVAMPQKVASTPATTVEALMYVLRRGLSCLDDPANRARLRSCDDAAMKEIVARLRTWKSRNASWLPAWSDTDIAKLAKAWRMLRRG